MKTGVISCWTYPPTRTPTCFTVWGLKNLLQHKAIQTTQRYSEAGQTGKVNMNTLPLTRPKIPMSCFQIRHHQNSILKITSFFRRRYVLPLMTKEAMRSRGLGANLVTLDYTSARAQLVKNSVWLTPQLLADVGCETPTIDYARFRYVHNIISYYNSLQGAVENRFTVPIGYSGCAPYSDLNFLDNYPPLHN